MRIPYTSVADIRFKCQFFATKDQFYFVMNENFKNKKDSISNLNSQSFAVAREKNLP